MINTIFFAKEGERGLNETSAQHLCALASQLKDEAEKRLNNVSFLNIKANILGAASQEMLTKIGFTPEEFDLIKSDLQLLADMNSFIAWFAEARNQLETAKMQARKTTFDKWAEQQGKVLPTYDPVSYTHKEFTLEDMKESLSIGDLQQYLALEASAAVLGQFIHPDQPLEVARTELHTKLTQPYSTDGNGRDTIVSHYEASIDPKNVDALFIELQKQYRKTEQALNKMKSELRHKLDLVNAEESAKERENTENNAKLSSEYMTKRALLRNEYNQWLRDEETRLSKVKLVIPAALEKTVEYLNKL